MGFLGYKQVFLGRSPYHYWVDVPNMNDAIFENALENRWALAVQFGARLVVKVSRPKETHERCVVQFRQFIHHAVVIQGISNNVQEPPASTQHSCLVAAGVQAENEQVAQGSNNVAVMIQLMRSDNLSHWFQIVSLIFQVSSPSWTHGVAHRRCSWESLILNYSYQMEFCAEISHCNLKLWQNVQRQFCTCKPCISKPSIYKDSVWFCNLDGTGCKQFLKVPCLNSLQWRIRAGLIEQCISGKKTNKLSVAARRCIRQINKETLLFRIHL